MHRNTHAWRGIIIHRACARACVERMHALEAREAACAKARHEASIHSDLLSGKSLSAMHRVRCRRAYIEEVVLNESEDGEHVELNILAYT